MDNYNTCPFVIIRSTTNAVIPRTPFYGLEPSTLPPLPQGAPENEGFHLKMLLSRKNVLSLMRNRNCSNVATNHSVRKTQLNNLLPLADWMHHLVHIFWTILFWSWLQAARVKLHLWVSQLHSVYFCIWRKGDGLEGGRFGAKQTVRVSTLKVNITLCLNYTPSALQFSHTLVLYPLSFIPANTPSSQPS